MIGIIVANGGNCYSAKFRCCCILWSRVVTLPHVGSVQQRELILCVAGVLWRTSVLGVLSVRTALNQGDGSPALTSVSLPLSLPHSSFWTLPPSWEELFVRMQRLMTFILQLNVTVSPVPGLPEGLTYNCSFSGSGAGFPLVVPAIEMEAGTQYQCNITGSISDLSSIAHGMSEHTQRML